MSESEETSRQEARRRSRKLSAFAMATESESVSAEIDVGDVLLYRPAWTHKQAADFLREHSDRIGRSMVIRGVETLAAILGEDTHAN